MVREKEEGRELGRGPALQTLRGHGKEDEFCPQSTGSRRRALNRRGRYVVGSDVNILCDKKVILSCRQQIRKRESSWEVSIIP